MSDCVEPKVGRELLWPEIHGRRGLRFEVRVGREEAKGNKK